VWDGFGSWRYSIAKDPTIGIRVEAPAALPVKLTDKGACPEVGEAVISALRES